MSATEYPSFVLRTPSRRALPTRLSAGRLETIVVAVAVCLPVPLLAATGLSVPLPNVVERIAAALVPWAEPVAVDAGALKGARGTIVPTVAEERSAGAVQEAQQTISSHITPTTPAKTPAAKARKAAPVVGRPVSRPVARAAAPAAPKSSAAPAAAPTVSGGGVERPATPAPATPAPAAKPRAEKQPTATPSAPRSEPAPTPVTPTPAPTETTPALTDPVVTEVAKVLPPTASEVALEATGAVTDPVGTVTDPVSTVEKIVKPLPPGKAK